VSDPGFALRRFLQDSGFNARTVFNLAPGIVGATAIISVVNAQLFSLPTHLQPGRFIPTGPFHGGQPAGFVPPMGILFPTSGRPSRHRLPIAMETGRFRVGTPAAMGPEVRSTLSSVISPGSTLLDPVIRAAWLALFLGLAGGAKAWASDWPQWRGPERNGTSPEDGWSHSWPGGEPPLAWKSDIGKGLSSIAVAGGAAYTLGNRDGSNVVWCLDAAEGRVRWTYRYPEALMDWQFEGGPCSTPLVSGGRVYAVGRSATVHCLDAGTGRLVWESNLRTLTGLKPGNWGLNGSPLLARSNLILNFGTAGIALDPLDGSQRWLTGPEDNTYTSPIPGRWKGRDVLFVAGSERLAIVDPVDGQIRWSRPFHVGFKAGDPVRTAGGVFFPSVESGGAYVRLPENGEPELAWTQASLGAITGTPVRVGRHLFGVLGSNNGKGALTCFEPETGKVLWSRSGFGWGSLLAAGDRLLVLSEKGEVSVVRASPEKAVVLGRFQALGGKCWSAPAFSEGRLFLRNAQGRLVAYDLDAARRAAAEPPAVSR
jgi:outer membrane protein assembly factor BamB